jgi:hypothetical protein
VRSTCMSTTGRPIISVGFHIMRSRLSLASRTRSVTLPYLVARQPPHHSREPHRRRNRRALEAPPASLSPAEVAPPASPSPAKAPPTSRRPRGQCCRPSHHVRRLPIRSRVSGVGARRLGGGRLAGAEAWGAAGWSELEGMRAGERPK